MKTMTSMRWSLKLIERKAMVGLDTEQISGLSSRESFTMSASGTRTTLCLAKVRSLAPRPPKDSAIALHPRGQPEPGHP
jgi:hypothetical protein